MNLKADSSLRMKSIRRTKQDQENRALHKEALCLACSKGISFILLVVLICAGLFAFFSTSSPSQQAFALEVEKTTARPNQKGGDGLIGGVATRVTWEARLAQDEDLQKLRLDFPEGSDLSQVQISDVVLEGLKRVELERSSLKIEERSLSIEYAQAIAPGSLLRIQIEGIRLPSAGGSVQIEGSYSSSTALDQALPPSPALEVISSSTVDKIVAWLDNQDWVKSWNSVAALDMFLRPQLVVSSLAQLFPGWLKALALVILGFPLAIPIGLLFSFLKMSASRIGRFIAGLYINVIRGTPLFLQIYIAFFGLPLMGININNYVLGVVVLALNSSAYLSEIFRAGIQSINKGQFEAAASLGMNRVQTMCYVIIPQTFRRVIPTMTSEFILLYKDTSLLSSVGVLELMMFSKNLTASTGNITPYVVAAFYYLLVTLPLIKLVGLLERKLDASESGVSSSKEDKSRKDNYKQGVSAELNPSTHGSM